LKFVGIFKKNLEFEGFFKNNLEFLGKSEKNWEFLIIKARQNFVEVHGI